MPFRFISERENNLVKLVSIMRPKWREEGKKTKRESSRKPDRGSFRRKNASRGKRKRQKCKNKKQALKQQMSHERLLR